MDSQSGKISSLPPVSSSSCTIKRSFVKVTSKASKEFNTSTDSMPSLMLSRRDSFEGMNRKMSELKNRPESPHSLLRFKLCDNSSGYGSATSFSSALHSIQRTPSMHCFSNYSQQTQTQPTITVTVKRNDQSRRPNKAQMIKDSLVHALDQIDKRVAFLRETASELEEEKRKLYKVLNTIITSEELNSCEEVEQEEIKVTTHGLLYRLNSVDISLNTQRTESQEKALENVSKYIERLSECIKKDRNLALQMCQSYLGACSSDHSKPLPVDDKFQKSVVECSLDDQKKIKKKLENLFTNINKIDFY